MRIIALYDDDDVIDHILKHLKPRDPIPDPATLPGPDPPGSKGETLPLTYHVVPDIA